MHPSPLEIVQQGYAGYAERDLIGVFALLSPDIEIVQTEELPWGGHYYGHDGAREFFTKLNQHTEAIPEPQQYALAGNHVAVIGRLRGRARPSGRPIDLAFVHVWEAHEGLIVRFAAYIDTPAMKRALGSD